MARKTEKIVQADGKDLAALKELARGYEKIKSNAKAVEIYNKYLELVKDPAEYKMIKDRIDRLDNFAGEEESVGLIDKIIGFFNKSGM